MKKDKKKIIFVMGFMRIGGIEKSLIRLCKALDSQKYEISVLLLCVGDGISVELPDHVERIFVSRTNTRSFKKQYSDFWSKRYEKLIKDAYQSTKKLKKRVYYEIVKHESKLFKKYVKKLFADYSYDICVGFMQGEPSDIAMNCINADNKILFYRHGIVFEYLNDKEYYEKADKIVALSEGIKNDLILHRGVSERKIIVMHNVYDIEDIKAKSRSLCEFDKTSILKLVTIARVSPEKGILQAINCAKLLESNGASFIWIVVGNDNGKYAEICKQAVNDNGLNDKVIFVGEKANPYPYIRTADIYVQPSECEALPGTIVEALALEKPIVSTNTHGAHELITDTINGLICQYEPQEMANTIIRLINNDRLREQLIIGAKQSGVLFESEIKKYDLLFGE